MSELTEDPQPKDLQEEPHQKDLQEAIGQEGSYGEPFRSTERREQDAKLLHFQLSLRNDEPPSTQNGSKITLKLGEYEKWRTITLTTKLVTIIFSVIILCFYVKVYQWVLVYGSAPQMVLPFVVCSSYIMITATMGMAKLSRKKFPTYLAMTFDIQGAFLFIAVGAICFMCWEKAQGKEIIGDAPIHMPSWLNRRAILISAILGWVNSVIYVLDAMLAYRERWRHG